MKISIIDTVFPIGHKDLNNKLISLLPKKDNNILVINNGDFFEEQDLENVSFQNFKLKGQQKKFIWTIILQILNYIGIWFKLSKRKDDIKFFFTFENISFAFARILFLKSRNILFHHNNTDYLKVWYVRFFFKSYMNTVQHVVFSDFIKKRLVEIGVEENRIFVLTHPITKNRSVENDEGEKNLFLGLGYASDVNLFKEIIEFEDKNKLLKTNNIRLVLRSSSFEYDNDNISFFQGHLSIEEYQNLNSMATGILFLYPPEYKYRYSGGIVDALGYKKVIIGTSIPVMLHFKELYPNVCHSFETIEELFTIMINAKNLIHDADNYKSFLENHDDSKVKQGLEKIIFSS